MTGGVELGNGLTGCAAWVTGGVAWGDGGLVFLKLGGNFGVAKQNSLPPFSLSLFEAGVTLGVEIWEGTISSSQSSESMEGCRRPWWVSIGATLKAEAKVIKQGSRGKITKKINAL